MECFRGRYTAIFITVFSGNQIRVALQHLSGAGVPTQGAVRELGHRRERPAMLLLSVAAAGRRGEAAAQRGGGGTRAGVQRTGSVAVAAADAGTSAVCGIAGAAAHFGGRACTWRGTPAKRRNSRVWSAWRWIATIWAHASAGSWTQHGGLACGPRFGPQPYCEAVGDEDMLPAPLHHVVLGGRNDGHWLERRSHDGQAAPL